ncbi:deoxyribodipyrimidine photo-lyase-like [Panonychus citri]|uniref:deoxyribodipyrimidine photo-lyase-like n=1 Tax=Panonychus citri TaxID=50023 RepID=UPI0023080341|nr:deoxyribodipyrimidine photo-lyase-like [Panonychus citri]
MGPKKRQISPSPSTDSPVKSKKSTTTNENESTDSMKDDNLVTSSSVDDVKSEASLVPHERLFQEINKSRAAVGSSIEDFKFNKKRVRMLSDCKIASDDCGAILYWMSRDGRVEDNWALLYAQRLALKFKVPLHVCYCLVPVFLDASIRGFHFLLGGLEEVESDLLARNIQFHLLLGEPPKAVPQFVRENNIGGVVCDFAPLKVPMRWVNEIRDKLPEDIPFCQIDAHNIVPCWFASDKLEYAARTIRPKITNKLPEFLTHFPPVIHHPYSSDVKYEKVDWVAAEASLQCDRSVKDVDWIKPGYRAAIKMLSDFVEKKIRWYNDKRNDPSQDVTSNMSPYFHFGQIAPQRAVLVVQQYKKKYKEAVESWVEEAVIRRELADNFCFYNPNHDSIKGAPEWAQKTLNDHRKDKRPYVYSKKEFEEALTHDPLWNACQKQLTRDAKLHGYMRMYWAKKILEWSESPEKALEIAIYLNDKFELDGRDPNGFVGCLWSVGGIHDQGWAERPIFGKIRYMNYEGCKRKFDINSYMAKYKTISATSNPWTASKKKNKK